MLKHTVLAAALAAAFGAPMHAQAENDRDLAQLRDEIRQMKQDYEARIQTLEKRLQAAEAQAAQAQASAPAPAQSATAAAANANAFNPEVSLILGGTYANLKQDPNQFRIQGFVPGGEDIGPGARSFNLGESELTLRANVDPQFAGQLTFALAPDNSVGVEEAFFRTRGLSNGINLKGGRFLSAIGYLNSQHAHAWDFVDAPLAYQAFFGGQYKPDGVQLTWLAPTERFVELGVEAGNGAAFPGSDRNKNGVGSSALFAHVGDDIGDSASWRLGASLLHTGASERSFDDGGVNNAFSGHSNTWIVDAIYKWAPNGNATQTNFKLQGEYFRRRESGRLTSDTQGQALAGAYASAQSGWYLQGVYQFRPLWRVGLRYDKLYSGTPEFGAGLDGASFPRLASYNPSRGTVMLDYSPSEFSRFRLQFARDKSRPDATDSQIFLQYIMSLGAHGAHTF
ncbi:hypothetical protein [Noviherbaspirillum sp. UKPF54]|uniref:hypothetical protein n=1 Tax=Noviherbaspirillum sp. UKPF54 TaxID=2601898 RepID=UPI0011B13970|nr:hypothetical protein [Noviherbaspirillum sp. UKPF54]QDZ29623.1 hypothetical protein FAY22_17635 [Noviherbaspirillum sp. UKPF54]